MREQGALTLANPDVHRRLVVNRGREYLRALHRDGRVALDHGGRPAPLGFNRKSQRGHVEQDHVLHVPLQDSALDAGSDRHHLVGIHPFVRRLAGQFLGHLVHFRHARHPAHQHQLVNLARTHPGFLQTVQNRLLGPRQEIPRQLLKLRPAQRDLDVLRAGLIGCHKRQVDLVGRGRTQGNLGFLRLFLDPLQRIRLSDQVDAFLLLELRHHPVDDGRVPVVTTELCVSVGRKDLEDTVPDLKDRNIKGAAAQVIHRNLFVARLVQPVGQ